MADLICGAPCHYGGLSAASKHSRSELGWMWHCNRKVQTAGAHCWQHQPDDDSPRGRRAAKSGPRGHMVHS